MNPHPSPVRFDQARVLAADIARDIASEGFHVLLIRDVFGRFSLLADDRETAVHEERSERWRERFSRLGAYRTDRSVVCASQMFSADALLNSPRAVTDPAGPPGAGSVRFLDNTVVGEDWAKVFRPAGSSDGDRAFRTALYGFKGGVGRTTATAVLARHLADRGHLVLVVDLDLESPGAGPLLVGKDLPPYGLVDQLVESAVGNADGMEFVTRSSYTPRHRFGELWVAPARGEGPQGVPYSYVDKLNRVYADTADADFADRLEQAVCACEDAVECHGDSGGRPDVVLLDSRAGIHDVAAVAISRLSDLALLFGVNNAQTWEGYGDLFTAWRGLGQAPRIRERLRMVAAMVPDSAHYPMEEYLTAFRKKAFECFDSLYDDVAAGDEQGAGSVATLPEGPFAPSENEESAPHWAVPILFEPGLVGMDAVAAPGWQDRAFVRAAYGEFLETVGGLVEEALAARGSESRDGTQGTQGT